ncbi:MAG: putative transcriptional regulator [Candidatus Bathyarchaeota archaeon B26-2]|nr:MAG: putative transcriptional regulator [Candidatus Bathyarchaeota archaeon B26-2]
MIRVIESLLQGLHGPIILWLLRQAPLHGYGLMKELSRLTGRNLGPSIVYPFLHRLEENDLVESIWVRHEGRSRRYYSLTKKGEALLKRIRYLFHNRLSEVLNDFLSEESS